MTTSPAIDLTEIDSQLLPAEFLVDPYSPVGDRFYKRLNILKLKIVAASADLVRDRHIEVVKFHFVGRSRDEICELTGYGKGTVGQILKREDACRLLNLMRLLSLTESGPTEMQRKDLLWRIAVDSEKMEPRVAIAAIGEINRMEMGGGVDGGGNLTVIVQNNVLGKGPLDV